MYTFEDFWAEPTLRNDIPQFRDRFQRLWAPLGLNPYVILSYVRVSGKPLRLEVCLAADGDLTTILRYFHPHASQSRVLRLNARNTQRFLWAFHRTQQLTYHEVLSAS